MCRHTEQLGPGSDLRPLPTVLRVLRTVRRREAQGKGSCKIEFNSKPTPPHRCSVTGASAAHGAGSRARIKHPGDQLGPQSLNIHITHSHNGRTVRARQGKGKQGPSPLNTRVKFRPALALAHSSASMVCSWLIHLQGTYCVPEAVRATQGPTCGAYSTGERCNTQRNRTAPKENSRATATTGRADEKEMLVRKGQMETVLYMGPHRWFSAGNNSALQETFYSCHN